MLQVYSHSYAWSDILFLFYCAYSAFLLYTKQFGMFGLGIKGLDSIENYCFGTKL